MSRLVWDAPGTRFYEAGVDRGVVYLDSGVTEAWNGLTSVTQSSSDEGAQSYYLDGVKYLTSVAPGEYEGTIQAYTYPDVMQAADGIGEAQSFYFVDNQPRMQFGMTYRTKLGNDVNGDSLGYKIHILYNLVSTPSDRSYNSISDDPEITEFEWDVVGTPEFVPGARPTNHLIMDSRNYHPALLEVIEGYLYGTTDEPPQLLSPLEFYWLIGVWVPPTAVVTITDNGNGTWTADGTGSAVQMVDATTYTITGATINNIDANTYTISDG